MLIGDLTMADKTRFTLICPCCEATLSVDAQTGVIISHEEKAKPTASFDEMLKGLDKQKQQALAVFERAEFLLEQLLALLLLLIQTFEHLEKDKDKPYINPLDVD